MKTYWGAITDDGIKYLINSNLSAGKWKVLLFLLTSINRDTNLFEGNRNTLYHMINDESTNLISHQIVYDAFDTLEKKHIVFEGHKNNTFFINPNIYYRGGKQVAPEIMKDYFKYEGIDIDANVAEGNEYKVESKIYDLRSKGFPLVKQLLDTLDI